MGLRARARMYTVSACVTLSIPFPEGPIVAPVIDSVVRSSPLEADIDFSTELSANLFELYLYESTGDANQDRDTSVSVCTYSLQCVNVYTCER